MFSHILSILTAIAQAAFYITGIIAFVVYIKRRG